MFCLVPSLTKPSIEDDSALRSKVDEALTVYDEYVKNTKEGDAATTTENKDSNDKTEDKA